MPRRKKQCYIVPFNDDETATMYNDCGLMYEEGQTWLTDNQIRDILHNNVWENEKQHDAIEKMTHEQLIVEYDDLYYGFTHFAVVPLEKYVLLKEISDALFDCCGGDSSTYRACAAFNTAVRSHAIKVIEL